ncbi:MAG: permease [Candidatus Paceibacterota bacterium]
MIKINNKKISGGVIFLLLVIILYLILGVVDSDIIQVALVYFLKVIKDVTPIFVTVFILMFLFNLFLDEKKMAKFLGESAGIKGWFISIIGGVLSMGPIEMWYPLLGDMQKGGMKNSFITTFLYNRGIKLPLLPMMVHYFGLPFTVVLTFYMLVFSVINGILLGKILKL